MALQIKPEFQNKVVGFGKSHLPLGQLTQPELEQLVVIAKNDKYLQSMFVNYPTPAQTTASSIQKVLKEHPIAGLNPTEQANHKGGL